MDRRPRPPRTPLRRRGRARCAQRGRPGRLPQLHPSVPRADRRPPRGGLSDGGVGGRPGAAHLAHRDAGAAGHHRGRRPPAARPPGGDVRPRRDPALRHARIGRPRHRRGARLPGPALRRTHHAPRRVHGHPGPGRAADGRIGPGQERTGAGTHQPRPRPGGRRRGGHLPHQPDGAGRPLPGAAAEPAGSARHRPAGHQGHLRARPRCAGRCA